MVLFGGIGVVVEQLFQILPMRGGKLRRRDGLDRRRGAFLERGDARPDGVLAGAIFFKGVDARFVGFADAFELLLLAGELTGEQGGAVIALQPLAVRRQDAKIQPLEVLADLRQHGIGQLVDLDAVRFWAASPCVVVALQRRPALAGCAAFLPCQRRAAAGAMHQPLERKRLTVLAAVPSMPPLSLIQQQLCLFV